MKNLRERKNDCEQEEEKDMLRERERERESLMKELSRKTVTNIERERDFEIERDRGETRCLPLHHSLQRGKIWDCIRRLIQSLAQCVYHPGVRRPICTSQISQEHHTIRDK